MTAASATLAASLKVPSGLVGGHSPQPSNLNPGPSAEPPPTRRRSVLTSEEIDDLFDYVLGEPGLGQQEEENCGPSSELVPEFAMPEFMTHLEKVDGMMSEANKHEVTEQKKGELATSLPAVDPWQMQASLTRTQVNMKRARANFTVLQSLQMGMDT